MSVSHLSSVPVSSNHEPVVHLKTHFRVRVSRAGVPSYSYNAVSRSSFVLWEAAFERAFAQCSCSPFSVSVKRLKTNVA